METNMDERLERAVATLDDLIHLVRALGLGESALFLGMAKLQVQLDLHGITDEEFGAFCDAVENGASRVESAPRARAGHARPRREGDLRGMRRSWQCPQGADAPRGGRKRAKQ